MLKEMQSLRRAGKIELIIISGSALKRIRESLINTELMQFIDDFDKQVYSGEKDYKSKDELMTRLCTTEAGYIDTSRLSYSGDGYGDAKSSNLAKLMESKCDYDDKVILENVEGDKRFYFIGKSEGAHCVEGHKEKLRACGVDVMTTTGFGLHKATKDWLNSYWRKEAQFAKIKSLYLARGSWQHLM